MAPCDASETAAMRLRFAGLLALLLLAPTLAQAWWNEEWSFRKKITLDTSAAAADTQEGVSEVPVLLRLHTGNFSFLDANESGSDLRFVGADDKTPLHAHIELWDPTNELALVWVRVPHLSAASAADYIWLYFGNKKASAEDDPKQRYDLNQTLVLHFNGTQDHPVDASGYANPIAESSALPIAQGPIDGAVSFNGNARVRIAANPVLKLNPQAGFTFSSWVRIAGPQAQAVLFNQADGVISIGIAGTKAVARVGSAQVQSAADLTPNTWHAVAVTLGAGKLTLYVDGKAVGQTASAVPDVGGDLLIGGGLNGDLDEIELSNIARAPDWIKATWAAQSAEAKLIRYGEDEQAAGGGHSYFKILLSAVTLDGWVVIGVLMLMMLVSFVVMIGKAVFVVRTDQANQRFLERFQQNPAGMLDPAHVTQSTQQQGGARTLQASSLFRLYRVGLRELGHRFELYKRAGQPQVLSAQAMGAIKASLDASMVREGARLNSQMVLLTIAISGGPFLGLLGTVVGVMITFAAIAAAGDVNVNSIAPGIAAALVATVAGLGVAIPALFGYNYLASRIKNISNEMAVFADELVTRMAEKYAP
jgi:biopolymer transport protein ExbB